MLEIYTVISSLKLLNYDFPTVKLRGKFRATVPSLRCNRKWAYLDSFIDWNYFPCLRFFLFIFVCFWSDSDSSFGRQTLGGYFPEYEKKVSFLWKQESAFLFLVINDILIMMKSIRYIYGCELSHLWCQYIVWAISGVLSFFVSPKIKWSFQLAPELSIFHLLVFRLLI